MIYRSNIKINSSGAAKVVTFVKFPDAGKTYACLADQDFYIETLLLSFNTYKPLCVSFSVVAIITSKVYQIFNKLDGVGPVDNRPSTD